MARLPLALLLCGVAAAQERAFVEVTAGKDAYYAGESIGLKLRFGFDRDFFRDHAVPLFARPMDLPVQVQAQLPGWPGTYDPNAVRRGPTFALNEDVVASTSQAEETRDGRVFTVVEAHWRTGLAEPGELAVAGPTLRYAHATEFHEDFVMGRVARDPRQESVAGDPLRLPVLPLPEEGRPPEFKGAVGRFTLSAEASRTSLAVGDTLVLTVSVVGHGSHREPDVDLRGFHVLGTIRSGLGAGGHSARHHLKLLSADVKEIQGVRLAFFDPGPPAGYRVVSTDPIPLEIQGTVAEEPPPPPPAGGASPLPFVVTAVVAVAAIVFWARSRRRVAPPDPHRVRIDEALAAVRARGDADTFAELLALYLRCPPAAVIGPDLPARLAAKGMKPALATRAAAALESLVAARYGGGLGGAEELRQLLPEIEAATGGGGSPTSGSPAPPR